jgi:peptidoglycan/LPS O-acetylase OafA/YrhL
VLAASNELRCCFAILTDSKVAEVTDAPSGQTYDAHEILSDDDLAPEEQAPSGASSDQMVSRKSKSSGSRPALVAITRLINASKKTCTMDHVKTRRIGMATQPPAVAPKKFTGFHYLRGLAATLIFSLHFTQTNNLEKIPFWGDLSFLGGLGPDLFAALSGFVVAYSISHKNHSDTTSFFSKALFRLIPVYWLITVAALVTIFTARQWGVTFDIPVPSWGDIVFSFLFLSQVFQNRMPVVAQGWFLEVLVAFLILAAISLLLSRFISHPPALLLTLTLISALTLNPFFWQFAGGVLGFMVNQIMEKSRFTRGVVPGLLLLSMGLALLALRGVPGIDLGWIGSGMPASLIVFGVSMLPRIRETRFATHVGRVSFPFFLLQWLTLPVMARAIDASGPLSSSVAFAAAFLATWAGAVVITKLWDAPFQRRIAAINN